LLASRAVVGGAPRLINVRGAQISQTLNLETEVRMKRRDLLAGIVATGIAAPAYARAAQEHEHEHDPIDGPLATATVSFGAWPSDPPLDRIAPPPPGPPRNVHQLIPNLVTIKAGGTVNFVIAGFHNPAVYGPGVKPEDINATITIPVPGAPPGFPPLIDDATKRIYRGPNPFTLPQDRTEVVHFPKKGLYLVICAFVPHFADGMFGWVRVLK
jgi:plastocyanin